MRTLLHLDNRAHQVAFIAPELQQAAAVRLTHRIPRRPHVEGDTAILKQRGRWMLGEIAFDCPG
jgi:hypothetical protein